MSDKLEPSTFQIKHHGIDTRDLSLFYIMASGVTLGIAAFT
jgi:hypothetical protein